MYAGKSNPYRFGVLVGNHPEDRFGNDVKTTLRGEHKTVKSEYQQKYPVYDAPPQPNLTYHQILEKKKEEDYQNSLKNIKEGLRQDLLFGHGPTTKEVYRSHKFSNQDFKTVSELMISENKTSNLIINSHFKPEQTVLPTTYESQQNKDLRNQSNVPIFQGVSERIPKGYGESTSSYDKVHLKIGLRK